MQHIQFLRRNINIPFGFRYLLFFWIIYASSCATEENRNLQYQSDHGKRLVADQAMVSSAHPLASEAGLEMMKNGGNAVDAAVAVAFALNVVEPNMSGIGGGGSMLIWLQEQHTARYVDFYSAKRAETYRNPEQLQTDENRFDLLSTGVPGTVAGLLEALERHGTLSRQDVMAPAIRYASEGFPVYMTLAQFIHENEEKLSRYEGAKDTFWPDGEPLQVGEVLRQPELAKTLQKISDGGIPAFYESDLTRSVVTLMNDAGNPVTMQDFADYAPQWQKTPLCGSYKDHTVLSAPPPQTGMYILQALNILEEFSLGEMGLPTVSAGAFDLLASVMRLAAADRVEYVTDPNWRDIPVDALISKEYAGERRSEAGTGSAPEQIEFGIPENQTGLSADPACKTFLAQREAATFQSLRSQGEREEDLAYLPPAGTVSESEYTVDRDEAAGSGETTHISVVDPLGNAVSLSTTLSPVFGSGAWTNGFILNQSGYNFSNPEEDEWNSRHPYRIRASTISPTIILRDGEVRLVIGAPGGGRIPGAILQNILYIIEYGLDPLDAVKMPRIFPDSRNTGVQLEKGFQSEVLRDVRQMGYNLRTLSSGYARLYLVARENGKLIGVADPRHDGEVRGM